MMWNGDGDCDNDDDGDRNNAMHCYDYDHEEKAAIVQNWQNDPPFADCGGGGFDKKGNFRLLR